MRFNIDTTFDVQYTSEEIFPPQVDHQMHLLVISPIWGTKIVESQYIENHNQTYISYFSHNSRFEFWMVVFSVCSKATFVSNVCTFKCKIFRPQIVAVGVFRKHDFDGVFVKIMVEISQN